MFSHLVKESNDISRMEILSLLDSLKGPYAQVDPEDAYLYANIMRVLLGTGRFYFIDSEIVHMNNIIDTYDCSDSDPNSFVSDLRSVLEAIVDCINGDANRIIKDDGTITRLLTDEVVKVID